MTTPVRSIYLHSFFYILLTMIPACNPVKPVPLKIAVSKATKNYINWIKKADSSIIPVNMYELGLDSAMAEMEECSGLLVTGGEDVQPEYYGKANERNLCGDMDPYRDTLEIALINRALELKMPVLGICRGEQIINVALGGSLIVDIPAWFSTLTGHKEPVTGNPGPGSGIRHQCEDYLNCFHSVKVVTGSRLRSITGCDTGFVNTNHHQAADRLAPGLRISSKAPDGITEGIEWSDREGRSFLIGVQWHPERMDTSNSFSGKLLKEFYFQAVRYHESRSQY
jgi:putative glutamine amidotransferase